MRYFLAKTEPGSYSIDDLQREGRTVWDGIKNPQALKAVRTMQPGDRVFIYHTGGESAVAGLAEVASEPSPDPKNPSSSVVDLKYLRHLDPRTSLAEIKASGLFAQWALVRQGRLSTMEAPQTFVDWMRNRHPGVDI